MRGARGPWIEGSYEDAVRIIMREPRMMFLPFAFQLDGEESNAFPRGIVMARPSGIGCVDPCAQCHGTGIAFVYSTTQNNCGTCGGRKWV